MVRAILISVAFILLAGVTVVHGPTLFSVSYVSSDSDLRANTDDATRDSIQPIATTTPTEADNRPAVAHVPIPEPVKAIYMSACVAGTPSFREDLVRLVNETELNSIMIDIKDYSGTLAFRPQGDTWQPAWQASKCGARDMQAFIADLHAQGIFVIGRITVFQDPFQAERRPDLAVLRNDGSVWTDYKGLGFIDVAAEEFWDDIVELSVEAYNIGFDELNYDYVRYPSDGNMRDMVLPHTKTSAYPNDKAANLEAFFVYLQAALDDESRYDAVRHVETGRDRAVPWTSADLFGMTTTNYNDLSIGQIQERAAPYFDFIAPMVYPSHYPNNWHGFANPNEHPYGVVYAAMASGVSRMQATTTRLDGFMHERIGTSTPPIYQKPAYGPERLRTWIQDFNYGGTYDAAAVRAQIQASEDAGVKGWMLWAPSNRYTQEALHPATTTSRTGE